MKVLFHVIEEDKWKMALANIKNFLREEPEAEISVVANGPAVKYYTDKQSALADFSEQVDFIACNNSLKGHDIEPVDLDKSVRIVKAGVVEIVSKQTDGYAYIKP